MIQVTMHPGRHAQTTYRRSSLTFSRAPQSLPLEAMSAAEIADVLGDAHLEIAIDPLAIDGDTARIETMVAAARELVAAATLEDDCARHANMATGAPAARAAKEKARDAFLDAHRAWREPITLEDGGAS
jgi:hypothetical protein